MSDCPICGRELGDVLIEEHHLVPRTFKGKDTIMVHKMCHQKIHATFSERELLQYYHTPERICEHSEMEKFIAWITKKPPEYYNKNDDTANRKRKRKN
jgi:hypothetical protein